MRARFSRWDGTQEPLDADPDLGRVLDEVADDLLAGWGGEHALRELHRRGIPGALDGLDSLLERVRIRRRRLSEELDLAGPLKRTAAELDHIVALERAELSLDDAAEARAKESLLDALPGHPAGAMRELMHYEFTSAAAAARFQELLESLRRDVLDANFKGVTGALRGAGPQALERMKDMLGELNAMVAARGRGDDYDFAGFMGRYGDMWPETPGDLDELLEVLARRMAAMSRLVAGLTSEQRRELAEITTAVLADMDLEFQMTQLAATLRETVPELAWDEPAPAWGEGSTTMAHTLDAVERVSELEELERALAGDYPGAALEDVDDDVLRRALDDDAVRDLGRLKRIERALQEAGVLARTRGRLELTARGARLLGERSLTRLLARARRDPTHRARSGGAEPTGQTRPWTFGDDEAISVQRTVYNAVLRSSPGRELRLCADDFEVAETESRPRTATALLLDLSFSMPLGGHWIPAKRMALALDALVAGKYPQDELHLIGFSDYARPMKPADLARAGWEQVHGTNMQHAFMLAGRVLAEAHASVKQVIMVTDGEPTAHLDADGVAFFSWPPARATIEKTLREALRLARSGIAINVFMLESSPGLLAFMDKLARLTGGEVVAASSGALGHSIVGRYARGRGPRGL